jgi:hypothetical protein
MRSGAHAVNSRAGKDLQSCAAPDCMLTLASGIPSILASGAKINVHAFDCISPRKAWAAWQRLYSRSAPAGAHPSSTTLQDEKFRSEGLAWRFRKRWGKGNALIFGTVLYHDNAPFQQFTSSDITAPFGSHDGTPRLDQARDAWYGAVFAENVFRLPGR